MYVCMYVCVYVCIFIYIYVYDIHPNSCIYIYMLTIYPPHHYLPEGTSFTIPVLPGRSRLGGVPATGAAGGRDRGLRRDPAPAALRGAAEPHGVRGPESLGAAV